MANHHGNKQLKAGLFARSATRVSAARCHWCGTLHTLDELTVDHLPPRALGGGPRDAVLACRRCNDLGGRMVAAWLRAGLRPAR